MKKRIRKLIPLLLALSALSSCAASHFVDPISTPVFTAPLQGEVQGNIDAHDKISIQGACSLPMDFAIDVSRENWSHGLSNDQEGTSVAAGHFWPIDNSSILVLGGFGFGSHRLSNLSGYSSMNASQKLSYTGNNDFRDYFLQLSYSHTLSNAPLRCDIGVASRFIYLDQYNFYQSELEWTVESNSNVNSDSSLSIYTNPRQSTQLDFAGFFTVGIEHIQLYLQLLVQLPLASYTDDPVDVLMASCGLKVAF